MVVQRAKTEVVTRKKSRNLITSIKRTQKEKMGSGGRQKARRDQLQKMGVDQAADTGMHRQHRKTKRSGIRTGRGAGIEAEVRRDAATVKERIRGEKHPGIRNVEQEAQIEVRLETRIEAGAPEARVIRETTARSVHPTRETKIEELRTKEDEAAALKVTETGRRVKGALIPGGEQRAPPNPKTEEAQPDQDQIVQNVKTETTARGINRALAPVLTATEPVKIS